MMCDEAPNSDSVSFDLAKRIWADSGCLPVALARASFGGTLSLLYEASRISEALGVPKILYTAASNQTWLQSLAGKFEYAPDAQWPSYPSDLKGLNTFEAHSTLRMLSYPELLSSGYGKSIWSDTVIEETALFLDTIVVGKAVLFATKFQDGQGRVGDFARDEWKPILRQLSNSYKVFVLGSNPTRRAFGNLGVVFLADILSLPAQVELVSSQTIPLVGDASGFFAAAIWQRGPYLCFKHPNYDEIEMSEEHDGADQLRVGSDNQYLFRMQPNLELLQDFLRKANHGK